MYAQTNKTYTPVTFISYPDGTLVHIPNEEPYCGEKQVYVRPLDYVLEADDFTGAPVWVEDDGCSVDQPYFTTSGDNGIVESEADQNDAKRSAGGMSDIRQQDWERPRYYSAKRFGEPEKKAQHRNYWNVVRFVRSNANNLPALQRAWRKFWRKNRELKTLFVSPRHVQIIKAEFRKVNATVFVTAQDRKLACAK